MEQCHKYRLQAGDGRRSNNRALALKIIKMNIDFSKLNGLVPAVIQDNTTLQVLMTGFMNEEALNLTLAEGKVTFFSRSRNCLWTKVKHQATSCMLRK